MVLLSFPLVLLSVDVCSECLLPFRSRGLEAAAKSVKYRLFSGCVCVLVLDKVLLCKSGHP